ncbi:MAG: glycosyltransferase family 39 protein, partial [Amphritea sp.]|nr:glycosyltransferase family 39 protein [Amphritea sp.]
GYTTQPPLYTWLQWGVFQVFGHGVLGLAILKAGLIFSIYFFVWQIARRLISSHQMALLAAFALILIPSVSWESIRDLTHSVLATAIAAATFFAAIRIYEDRSALAYLLLGGLLAAGMLSKYSFAVFALSLLLAALSLPAWRGLLFDKRILLTVFAGTVVALPHLIWAISHLDEISAFIGQQVHAESDGGFVSGVIAGLGSLVKNIAEFVLLLVLVVSLICPRLYRRRSDTAN